MIDHRKFFRSLNEAGIEVLAQSLSARRSLEQCCHEAADQLDQAEARVAELEAERDTWKSATSTQMQGATAYRERCEELEAERDAELGAVHYSYFDDGWPACKPAGVPKRSPYRISLKRDECTCPNCKRWLLCDHLRGEIDRLTALVADSSAKLAAVAALPRCGLVSQAQMPGLLLAERPDGAWVSYEKLRAALASPQTAAPAIDHGAALLALHDGLADALGVLRDHTSADLLRMVRPAAGVLPANKRMTPEGWAAETALPDQLMQPAASEAPAVAPLVCPNCGPRRDAQAPEWQCLDCGACVRAGR